MKKLIVPTLLLATSLAHAFDGERHFTLKKDGIEHAVDVSNWNVDGRGVPSFDYRYRQKGAGCNFEINGHAVAGFEPNGKKVELEVHNPQDDSGKEMEPMLMFYDGASSLTMPLAEKRQGRALSYQHTLTAEQKKKSCTGNADDIALVFKKTR